MNMWIFGCFCLFNKFVSVAAETNMLIMPSLINGSRHFGSFQMISRLAIENYEKWVLHVKFICLVGHATELSCDKLRQKCRIRDGHERKSLGHNVFLLSSQSLSWTRPQKSCEILFSETESCWNLEHVQFSICFNVIVLDTQQKKCIWWQNCIWINLEVIRC